MTDEANTGAGASQLDQGGAAAPPTAAPVDTSAAPPPPPPEPPKRDYVRERMQDRIDRLTAEKAARDAEILRLKAGATRGEAELAQQVEGRANEIAGARAAQLAAWNTFSEGVNRAVEEGKKEFGQEKFNRAVDSLKTLQGQDGETRQRYINLVQAMLDTDAAPKLILALGEDTNEAARLMGLSPTKMGVELGKLAAKDATVLSGAPKPLTPISGAGSRSHVAISAEDPERADQLDKKTWMARREAHVSEVNKRNGRRSL